MVRDELDAELMCIKLNKKGIGRKGIHVHLHPDSCPTRDRQFYHNESSEVGKNACKHKHFDKNSDDGKGSVGIISPLSIESTENS